MIDIAISGLVKEFEVGKKILDGLTFQVDSGERVGLLGKNGCGKTTLLRILTGQLDWDEGEVVLAPDKRVGLISQIPVYPAGYTVEDVLRSAFARLQSLAEGCPVVRIMPNTPVSVGAGLVLYTPGEGLTKEQESQLTAALAHAGQVDKLPEPLLDAASAVAGCGPAFACQFLEALADGGVACGLPREKAYRYGAQMLLGTASLLLATGSHPGQLKDAVCSPGGTTIQGVRVLEEHGLRAAVMDAVLAAFEKNGALASSH